MPQIRQARRLVAAAAVIALALGASACSADEAPRAERPAQVDAALPDGVVAEMRTAVETAMTATGSPGALVGVWVPWSGVWVEGLGSTTPGGPAVSPDMAFKATTITRAMTCDVLYGLAADGVVGLDDPFTNWLGGYPGLEAITLRQLCDGTSGLKPYSPLLLNRWLANPARDWNPNELAAYGVARGLGFSPGSAFTDADTGYVLLGSTLVRATGRPLEDLYQQYVFDVLDMNNSSLPETMPTAGVLPGLQSLDVDGVVDCTAPADYTALSPSAGGAAAGVVSTLDDVARYVQALALGLRPYDENRLADDVTINAEQPAWFTAGGGVYRAGNLVGHYGSLPGYMTAAFADRTTGLTVVAVLNNSRASSAIMQSLSWELAAIASKAPAAEGTTAPESGYPWTPTEVASQVADRAICS